MKRREFLGTMAAGITARMTAGPAPKPKYDAAAVEAWMGKSRDFDAAVWRAMEGLAELEKHRPSFADLAKSKGLLG